MELVDSAPPVPPSNPAASPEAGWFRLALLLTGDPSAACEILRSVFGLAAEEMAQFRSKERRKAWLIRQIRSRSLKWHHALAPEAEPASSCYFPSRVAALPESARSAFALFHCLDGSIEELAELLGLTVPAFQEALTKARQGLEPGVVFPEKGLVRAHRPWGEDSKAVAKAVLAAHAAPELEAQIATDQQCHEEIARIPIPEELAALSLVEPPKPGFWTLVRQPAVLAIALALCVVMGVLVYFTINRLNDFPGKDTVTELVDEAGALNGSEFEPISPTTVGKLDDWFVMKGFEGFSVPQELEAAKAVGCRVTKHEDISVAQVALDRQNAMLLVFRVAELKEESDGAGWHIFQQDDWAVAARIDKEIACVVLFQGTVDAMPRFLKSVGKQDR